MQGQNFLPPPKGSWPLVLAQFAMRRSSPISAHTWVDTFYVLLVKYLKWSQIPSVVLSHAVSAVVVVQLNVLPHRRSYPETLNGQVSAHEWNHSSMEVPTKAPTTIPVAMFRLSVHSAIIRVGRWTLDLLFGVIIWRLI